MRERTQLDQNINAVKEIERDLADNLGLIEMGEAEAEPSIVQEAEAALPPSRNWPASASSRACFRARPMPMTASSK